MSNISEQLKKLPAAPGVYKFLDKNKVILYIGKAASLKNRVGSYFQKNTSTKLKILVSQIHKIETIETDSVLESLILEANLIKKYQPRFNVKLKDDKSFVNIMITDEEYAAVQIGRPTEIPAFAGITEREEGMTEGTKGRKNIFGPFPSAKMAREAVEILQKIFLFRTCRNLPKRKCLLYDIGQCSAPCISNISPVEYKKSIKNLALFLQGKKKSVIKNLGREMSLEAKRENFERAAQLRNQIFALNHIKDIALIKKEGDYKNVPYRIEAYDISNIGGKMAVGSMVVFLNGKVASDEYRKFKIKSVSGANDVAMMKEVLFRRLQHKEWLYPDLIIVDGGKPQYHAVCEVMAEMKIMLPVIAIAKGPTRKKADLIFSANASQVDINLIKQLRDEAHRFAVKYHRKLREKF